MNIEKKRISKAVQLFEEQPMWKAMTYVISLSILVSFLQGLYVFISQILMVKIIPENPYFNNESIYGTSDVNNLINTTSIIRTVNTITAPFISIGVALSLAFGLGTSISYSKYLGSKQYEKAKETYGTGFYTVIIFGILTSVLTIIIANFLLPTQVGNIKEGLGISLDQITIFKNKVIEFAKGYVFIFIGANVFQCLMQLLSTCLNSEGRNLIVTIILVVSTILNVILVFIFLKYTKLGVNGSAIATVISWLFSVAFLYLYIYKLNCKKETLLFFSILRKIKIQWWILWLIFAIGSTSFLRNISSAVLSIVNNNEIINVTNQIGIFQDENYFTNINGAVIPIYNLLLSIIIGIVRGARTIISYLYSAKKFFKVKKIFLYSNIITIVIALMSYVLGVFILGDPLLKLFGFDESNFQLFNNAKNALKINTLSVITFSIGISGTLFFQSIGKPFSANFLAILQGILIGIPTIYINSVVSIQIGGEAGTWLFYASSVIAFGCSGLIILIYSFVFVYKKMDLLNKNNKNN